MLTDQERFLVFLNEFIKSADDEERGLCVCCEKTYTWWRMGKYAFCGFCAKLVEPIDHELKCEFCYAD